MMPKIWIYSKELKRIREEFNKIPSNINSGYDGVIVAIIDYFKRVERDLMREKEKEE